MRPHQFLATILISGGTLVGISNAAFAVDPAQLRESAKDYFEVIPSMVPAIAGNAVTREKVDLGKKLFFDPRLSASAIISCNTCHNLGMGGDDNLETSIGHGWQKGPATPRPFTTPSLTKPSSGTVVPKTSKHRPRARFRPGSKWPAHPNGL